MAPVIVAKDLYKCYPGFPPVLRGADISVEPGEIAAIMGPSGSGKSTMLHVLGLLHAPDAGALEVLGADVRALDREQTAAFRRGNLGFVMQSSNLFEYSTVFENVEFPLIYEKTPPEERWERVVRALELVRLSSRINYRSNRLSGGEQQRVAIARAMVNSPRILMADEPTGALDARTSQVIMQNFRTLAHEGGVAVIVVTHDSTVADFCDSVYALEDGLLNCRRKDPPSYTPGSGGRSLLAAARRRMDAVCVTGRFPQPHSAAAVQDVINLHGAGVLARVYSLYGAGLRALDGGGGACGLPAPVRRQNFWRLPATVLDFLRHGRGDVSRRLWNLWNSIPLRLRLRVWRWSRLARTVAVGTRMAGWGLEDQAEHIHALDTFEAAIAAWIAAGLLGVPFSFSLRARQMEDDGIAWALTPVLAADAAFVRCDTQALLDAARKACPDVPASVFVLARDGLTLPPPEFAAESMEREPLGQGGEITILTTGDSASDAGMVWLLRACGILKKQNAPFKLIIAGEGMSAFSQWVLRRRLEFMGLRRHVTVMGRGFQENMADLLRKAHIFVSATAGGEGRGMQWPSGLSEAMLYGLPVVATDLPGHTELIEHERNGLVAAPRTAEALAEALLRCARFPDLAARLGQTAREDALRFFEPENEGRRLADLLLADSPNLREMRGKVSTADGEQGAESGTKK